MTKRNANKTYILVIVALITYFTLPKYTDEIIYYYFVVSNGRALINGEVKWLPSPTDDCMVYQKNDHSKQQPQYIYYILSKNKYLTVSGVTNHHDKEINLFCNAIVDINDATTYNHN